MLRSTWASIFRRRVWVRVAIFVTLHLILFLSLTECALALYLFSTKQVDESKTPSLVLGFLASFLSVPFVVLHTLISIQYRNTARYNFPNSTLHIASLHLPRIMAIMWLAASVSGLVAMSKQAKCAHDAEGRESWRRKLSCQVYQTAIIFDIVGFFATCVLLLCVKICERPYDASLLGISGPKRPVRGSSLFSESSGESERLKDQVFYLCRHPNAGPDHDALFLTPKESSFLDAVTRHPSIRHPGPARVRPELRIATHLGTNGPSITTSELRKCLPAVDCSKSVCSQRISPVSRNSSVASRRLPPRVEEANTTQPPLPPIPGRSEGLYGAKHKRQQSSTSSNKFLPKPCAPTKQPSDGPQIRSISSQTLIADNDWEALSNKHESNSSIASGSVSTPATSVSSPDPTTKDDSKFETKSTHSDASSESKQQALTPSGESPMALAPGPLKIHKTQPTRKEDYTPPPGPPSTPSVPKIPPRSVHRRSTTQPAVRSHIPRVRPVRLSTVQREYSPHQYIPQNYHPSASHYRRQHYQHLHHPQPRYTPRPAAAYQPRRFHSYHSRFVPSQTLPPIPQDDDVAVVYPNSRRPRSSRYGQARPGLVGDIGGHGITRHTSLSLSACNSTRPEERAAMDAMVYRGAERTSPLGYEGM